MSGGSSCYRRGAGRGGRDVGGGGADLTATYRFNIHKRSLPAFDTLVKSLIPIVDRNKFSL